MLADNKNQSDSGDLSSTIEAVEQKEISEIKERKIYWKEIRLNEDTSPCHKGPDLWIYTDITKFDFMKICDEMDCFPENVCEGGFRYNIEEGYKTIRFSPLSYNNAVLNGLINKKLGFDKQEHWPWINKNTLSEWRNNSDILIYKNQKINTTLKAFYGAEPFTVDELECWEEVLAKFGIVCKKMPTTKYLKLRA